MNREQLWNMIGLADDKYVDEEIPAAGTKGVKPGKHRFAALLTAAALVILLAASAVAAHHFSVPKQLQENMYIEKSDITDIVDLSDPGKGGIQIENKSQETAGYTVTFEAIVSGSRLHERREGWGKDKTVVLSRGENDLYALFTLRRADGGEIDPDIMSDMDLDFVICEKGYMPREGAFETFRASLLENNVIYFACMITNAQIFADQKLYVAITDHTPDGTVLRMNANGEPYFLESYAGIGALFDLPLDPARADPSAAAEFRRNRGFNPNPDYSDSDEIMRLDAEFESMGYDLSGLIGANEWKGHYPLMFGEVQYSDEFISRRGDWEKPGVRSVSYTEAENYLSSGAPLPAEASSFTLPDDTVCYYMIRNIFFCVRPNGEAYTVTVPSRHLVFQFTESRNCVNNLHMELTYRAGNVYPDVTFSACYIDGIDPLDTEYNRDAFTEDDILRYYRQVTGDFTCVQDAIYRLSMLYSGCEGTVEYKP